MRQPIQTMKLIIAYIKPEQLGEVKKELFKNQIYRISATNSLGCGRQRGYSENYRGNEIEVNLLKKVRLEIAVNDEFVDLTVDSHHQGGAYRPHRRREDFRAEPRTVHSRAHPRNGPGRNRLILPTQKKFFQQGSFLYHEQKSFICGSRAARRAAAGRPRGCRRRGRNGCRSSREGAAVSAWKCLP